MNELMPNFSPAVFASIMDQRPRSTSWECIVKNIQDGSLAAMTNHYRRLADEHGQASTQEERDRTAGLMQELKRKLPAFLPSAIVEGGRAARHVKGLSGFVMIDIDHIPPTEMHDMRKRVKADVHTFLLYTTVSGRGLRVVARMEGVPQESRFRKLWKGANAYYARLAGCATDPQCSNPTRISCLCHDEQVHFHPGARPFAQEELLELCGSVQTSKQNGGRRATAERAAPVVCRMVEARGVTYAPGSHNQYISHCLYLMNRFGVPQHEATAWALRTFADYEATNHNVEATARSCYQNTAEHNTMSLSSRPDYQKDPRQDDPAGKKGKRPTVTQIAKWCEEHLELRYNLYLDQVEMKYKLRDNAGWAEVGDREECTLWVEMSHDGIHASPRQIHDFLISSASRPHDPLKEYLQSLPPWDGTDHLGRMAAMVHVEGDHGLFDHTLRQWYVGMLAGATGMSVVNQTVLVFVGKQGVYKTSFVNILLPQLLRRYTNTMNNMRNFNRDESIKLCENLVINCEEIDMMAPADLNRFKALVTELYVNDRLAYRRNKERRPHIASLVATGNKMQFLTDETGNRRWMPFHVLSIDNPMQAVIDYDGLFAQAYHLLKNGFKYWHDSTDVERNSGHVSQFEAPRPEYEMVMSHFVVPTETEKAIYLSSTQIVAYFGNCGIRLSNRKVGAVMSELGFKQVRTGKARFWMVSERKADDIRNNLPPLPGTPRQEEGGDEDGRLPF